MQTFFKKRGEILTYNAELCTEVFSAITCCSYGFREIIFSRNFAKPIFAKTIISKFRIVFTKKCEISGKNERNTNENFCNFSHFFAKVFVRWKPYVRVEVRNIILEQD